MPLILHIFDIQSEKRFHTTLSTSSEESSKAVAKKTQGRLNMLIEAMKIFRGHYDGIEYVSGIVRQVIDLTENTNFGAPDDEEEPGCDWDETFSKSPELYLRLAITMDFGFSSGQNLKFEDLPASLDELLRSSSTTQPQSAAMETPSGFDGEFDTDDLVLDDDFEMVDHDHDHDHDHEDCHHEHQDDENAAVEAQIRDELGEGEATVGVDAMEELLALSSQSSPLSNRETPEGFGIDESVSSLGDDEKTRRDTNDVEETIICEMAEDE